MASNQEWMQSNRNKRPQNIDSDDEKVDDVADTQSQTQTEREYTQTQESQSINEKSWWGRLHKKSILRRRLGTRATQNIEQFKNINDSVDMRGPQFTFGRDFKCDYILAKNDGVDDKNWARVSKVHFKITKDLFHNNPPIVIHDLSRNGTFVNGELIGNRNKRILRTGDRIGIVSSSIVLFDFEDLTIRKSFDLPNDMQRKYFIESKLGSGAFGDVFKVMDKHLQPFAVKHIKSGSAISNCSLKANTENEINIMKNLSHPCIIRTIEIMKYEQGGASIILEYMSGGDLLNRIISHPNRRLTEEQGRGIFYQVTRALQYLHSQGITHRDIKPDNVLLKDCSDDPLVKLSDFGLSKLVTDGTVLKSLLGTPNYVAPEILKCTKIKQYSSKVDVWSMGVMLFAMLSGTLPFAEDYGDIHAQVLRGKYEFLATCWEQVSDDAKTIIKRMLVVDPRRRISINELFATNWLNEGYTSIKTAIALMNSQCDGAGVSVSQQKSQLSLLQNKLNGFLIPSAPPAKRQRLQ